MMYEVCDGGWNFIDHDFCLFDDQPGNTNSRQERIDILDGYFEECMNNGMPFDLLPETYGDHLIIWESIWKVTCLDLLGDV